MRRTWRWMLTLFIGSVAMQAWAAPPAEVTTLGFCSGSKTCLSWSNLGSVQYRLYRGTQAGLPALQNASVDSCLVRMTTGLTSTGSVLDEVPPSGGLLWYLVTAKNCDGEGTPGNGTAGTRIVDSSGDCGGPTCNDGIQNGSETDVDCGGGGCPACANGKGCCAGASCLTGYCNSGTCALAPLGNLCSAGTQCASSQCVDGVCCNTSCSTTCASCNLPGTAGTCTPATSGTDPDSECGGVSCASFYWGWTGDTCFRKADVSASQATCGGANACQTQSTECSLQSTKGPAATTCHATCQDPSLATCTGTTAGTCVNVNPGNQTCGQGICQVTVPQCVNGAFNTCTPGTPTTETCNNLDDNCDGIVDNNAAFADGQEPNNDCAAYRTLPTVGSNQTLTQNTLTLYPSGDTDYFRINATETDSTCACCDLFCTDEDYRLTVTLTVPAGAGSYTFCTDASCGTVGNFCVTVNAGSSQSWTYSLDGSCSANDSYSAYFRISPGNAPGFKCSPYTLSYQFQSGLCL
jgi:hypothetical protein